MTARAALRRGAGLGAAIAALIALGSAAGPAAAATADDALQVSFKTGAVVRLQGRRFASRAARAADLGGLDELLARYRSARVQRVVHAPQAEVDEQRRRLLAAGRRDVPDLNRHYRIVVSDRAQRDRLLAALRRLPIVDDAIAEPEPVPAPATPSFTALQRYVGPAPAGIDAAALAARAGGSGDRARIIDVEYGWNTAHEDLAKAAQPGALIANGTPENPFSNSDHGTAVLGQLIATANAFGVTGLAQGSEIGMVNATTQQGWAVPDAVTIAHQHLAAGDVMLIEQQYPGVRGADDYVPIERWPAVYDAIRLATLDGIIVVETAGNGAVDLDGAAYGTPFPDGKPDSGAIVVGAGSGDCSVPVNSRLAFSTYGSRVDLQGWGQCVVTSGYGDLFNGGPNARYTDEFNGTSSAGAIVAAAAALYSSVFEAEVGVPPSPRNVRGRLVATGTAQGAGRAGHIGPLPNLAAALAGYDGVAPTVTLTGGPAAATSNPAPAFDFAASEAGSTFECRIAGVTPFAACGPPFTAPALSDGTFRFEVRATDPSFNTGPAATSTFAVDTVAPAVTITGGPSGSTADATPSFAFAAGEAGVAFACRIGRAAAPGTFAACTSPYTSARQPSGARVFEVRATDAAGNTGPSSTRALTVSGSAPAIGPGPGAYATVRVTGTASVRLAKPTVTCPRAAPSCSVTAKASIPVERGRRRSIGSVTFTVRAGSKATVRFTLSGQARASLARSGRLKTTVLITAKHGGRQSTRTVRITIRPRRR
jgi:serine protease